MVGAIGTIESIGLSVRDSFFFANTLQYRIFIIYITVLFNEINKYISIDNGSQLIYIYLNAFIDNKPNSRCYFSKYKIRSW